MKKIILALFLINSLLATEKKEQIKKNDGFLKAKPYIQNEELRSKLENLRKEFEIQQKNIKNDYHNKIETLKIERKNEIKSLRNDFASRRDMLFKKYPSKKRKKIMKDFNGEKSTKVESDKKKTPLIRKK
jgi:hypothetical protein